MEVRSGGVGALPDLVYPVKCETEELRYSLRSVAANASGLFRKVWLVGHRPEWVTGVEHIDAGAPGGKSQDVRAKVAAACAHPGVADTFVLMCDDFWLVEPIDRFEVWHYGTLEERVAQWRRERGSRPWLKMVTETAKWVAAQGGASGLCWQGHRPLMWDKAAMGAVLKRYPRDRELDVTGLFDLAGAPMGEPRLGCNTKVNSDPESFHRKLAEFAKHDVPWISGNEQGFESGMIGGYIRGIFRDPCRYEREV